MLGRILFTYSLLLTVNTACGPSNLYGDIKDSSDTESDTDTDTDADTDTDTDADADTADTGDTGTLPTFCHPFEPVETPNFIRQYDVLYRGSTGKETQTGYGAGVTANGNLGYQIMSESNTGLGDWIYYYLCEHNGQQGLFLGEWEGEVSIGPSIPGFPSPTEPIAFVVTPPLPLLPAPGDSGSMTSWTYSTNADANTQLTIGGSKVPWSGSISDLGLGHSITTPAGTFTNALKIEHEYVQDRSSLAMVGLGGITKASGVHYYVEGLGLVYEKVEHKADSDGTGTLLEKQLRAYTGLTPVSP